MDEIATGFALATTSSDCRASLAMTKSEWGRNYSGREKGLARTREVIASCRNARCFLCQGLRPEEGQCDGQKNCGSSEEIEAHSASGFSTLVGDKKARAKYDKEQAEHDGRCSPNSETSPHVNSTDEDKDNAQSDTDRAVSLGHRAEFSTPNAGRQSGKSGIRQ